MEQQVIKCQKCENEFVWSVEEQKLYVERGIQKPDHCPICRGIIEAEKRFEQGRKA